MQSKQLRKQHIQSFSKLTLSERLDWALAQHRFLVKFMERDISETNIWYEKTQPDLLTYPTFS